MRKHSEAPADSFEAEFYRRWSNIRERGRKVGLTTSHICREAEVARATPDRWEKEAPLSIKLIDKLESVVAKHEREAATAASR